MDSFRVVLILVGVVLIIGLVLHGVWTLRKNNQVGEKKRESVQRKRQQYENSQSDLLSDTDTDDSFQNEGFDELGIGKVKARKVSEPAVSENRRPEGRPEESRAQQAQVKAEAHAKTQESSAEEARVSAKLAPSAPKKAWGDDDDDAGVVSAKSELASENAETAAENPMQGAKAQPQPEPELPSVRANREDSEVEQLPIDLASAEANEEVIEAPKEEVITLFVSGDIKGTTLLETVTELGMKFGELDIFHRYEQPTGRGPLLFRMANMYNPGTFNLDDLDNFNTRGVVLFMTLPLKYDGHKAFTMMYNAANKIAEAMPRAAVLDGNRNPMTKQSVQHTYQKIREFERRMRLAGLRQDY